MRQPSDHKRRIEPNRAQHFADEFLTFLGILDASYYQRLRDDIADPPFRVERSDRILKDQLHTLAHLAQAIALHRGEVLAIEQNAPGDCPAQLQHRASQRRLAAAGLPDQTKGLASTHFQTDAGHRVNRLGPDGIFDDEIFHLEQGIA